MDSRGGATETRATAGIGGQAVRIGAGHRGAMLGAGVIPGGDRIPRLGLGGVLARVGVRVWGVQRAKRRRRRVGVTRWWISVMEGRHVE